MGGCRVFAWVEPIVQHATWTHVDALLWGVYWQNIRNALAYNVRACALARTPEKRLRSRAFLGYSLVFCGHE